MEIHRSGPEKNFTIIPNETLRDLRLSWRALGILAEILSRPDDWHTTAHDMWRQGRRKRGAAGEGRDATYAAFAELEIAGYMYRRRYRGTGGRFTTEIHVFDTAQELQQNGTPLFFKLAAQLEIGKTAGRTDYGTGSNRSDLRKLASSQVAPTTADQESADQESADQESADQESADQESIRRLSTKIYTETDTKIFNGNPQHEDAKVLQSPVPVESRPARPGQDHEFDSGQVRNAGEPARNASDEEEEHRRAKLAELAAWIAEHPESVVT